MGRELANTRLNWDDFFLAVIAVTFLCMLSFAFGRETAPQPAKSTLSQEVNKACKKKGYTLGDWESKEGLILVRCVSLKPDQYNLYRDYIVAVER